MILPRQQEANDLNAAQQSPHAKSLVVSQRNPELLSRSKNHIDARAQDEMIFLGLACLVAVTRLAIHVGVAIHWWNSGHWVISSIGRQESKGFISRSPQQQQQQQQQQQSGSGSDFSFPPTAPVFSITQDFGARQS